MTAFWTYSMAAAALGIFCAQPLAAETEPSHKQRFAAAMARLEAAPQEAARDLRALSDAGYARATERLAYLSFKGIGTAQDTSAAIALYQQAADAGRTGALVSLGKIQMTAGAHDMAARTLEEAKAAGHDKAGAVLAWAHATGRLGPGSDRAGGFDQLVALAQDGGRTAEMYLLDAAARQNRTPPSIGAVLDQLHARHDAGDARAAEALLRYYRAMPHPRGTRQVRAALLGTEGLRDKIRVEEGLYLARDSQPARFWTLSEELVRSAPPDVYARALAVTARINRNAYVRLVQQDLRAKGYPVGRSSAYLTAPLIRSIAAFCRDTGIADICRMGPLKSASIKAVAAQLAAQRSAG